MNIKMLDGNNLPHELLLTMTKSKIKECIWKQYFNWYKVV